ncbi:RNA 2'-phosphotransferase [Litorimonas sp. WD9-15]|uniref:RNA 2'-phosphotransferase n=1 Tax=Litorimonas sp. WD9-15 TaxID=3418716 RepID=UPI003D08C471
MDQNKMKAISKHLSYILRHKPDAIGLTLDPQGWADIDELISKSPKRLTRDLISEIVENNDKQRFIISEECSRIRANQGHSISIDLGLKPTAPPDILYHGTATRFLDAILEQGLKKMNRQHVHLSADLETATKVGTRHGKVVILFVDTRAMVREGHDFYISNNGVWLTNHVPPQYLSQSEH